MCILWYAHLITILVSLIMYHTSFQESPEKNQEVQYGRKEFSPSYKSLQGFALKVEGRSLFLSNLLSIFLTQININAQVD